MLTFLAAVQSATEIANETLTPIFVIEESGNGEFWSFSPERPEYGSRNYVTVFCAGGAKLHEMKD